MALYSNSLLMVITNEEVAPVYIRGITSMSHRQNATLVQPQTGRMWDVVHSMGQRENEIPFVTEEIDKVLGLIAPTGKCITSTSPDKPGVVLYAEQHDPCAANGRTAGATHMSVTFGSGHIYLESLTAAARGNATATLRCHVAQSDAAVDPVTIAYNATLPASAVPNSFVLGNCAVDGTTLTDVTNVQLNFNPAFDKLPKLASMYPRLVNTRKVPAVCTWTVDDPSWLAAAKIPRTGKASAIANNAIYLVKRTAFGEFVDFATAEHILVRIGGMAYIDRHYDANGNATSQTDLMIASTEQSGAAGVTFDTTSTYTAA